MCQEDFCARNCELLFRRFLQDSQTYKHITQSPDNSIISVKLDFVQFLFSVMSRPRANIRGGKRKKTQVKGRTEKRKTEVQEKYKKSDIISVKNVLIITADLSPNWWAGTSDSTGQNSLKLVHSQHRSGHDRKKIRNEIMQCVKTTFVFEIMSCFPDVFYKSLKFISILHPR